MSKQQKLELTWVGRERRPKLEPRILIENPARSHHAAHRVSGITIQRSFLVTGPRVARNAGA